MAMSFASEFIYFSLVTAGKLNGTLTPLCEIINRLMNKLRPGSIARIDPREDGKLRMSNVTKFLASCSANGLPPEELFLRDDLIEGTSDCLARVAKTIIALVKWAETPSVPTPSRQLRGRSKSKPINAPVASESGNVTLNTPYRTGSSWRAVMSSPNLIASSSQCSPRSPARNSTRRWTPPSIGLPTLRSDSPVLASSSSDAETAQATEPDECETPTRTSECDEVPPIVVSRSPMRSRPSERSSIAGDSPPLMLPFGESARASIADSTTNQSVASSSMTDTSTYSSLLDAGGVGNGYSRNSGAYGKFGTIRTVTTEATSFVPSEWPSMTRTEGSAMAASMMTCDENVGNGDSAPYTNNSPSAGGGIAFGQRRRSLEPPVRPRERRPSETIPVDLSRVVEESEEPPIGSAGGVTQGGRERVERIKLGQGKWPDDFLDALQAQNYASSRPIAIRKPSPSSLALSAADPLGHDEFAIADLAAAMNVSASPRSGNIEPPPPPSQIQPSLMRRTHRARHSVDAPVLAPRDSLLLPRDSSPDAALGSGIAPPGRLAVRRNSTRSGISGQRNGIYVPRRSSPDNGSGGDNDSFVAIPFPRAVSGEYVPSSSSLNVPSPSISDSFERTSSNEHRSTGSGSGSSLGSGKVNGTAQPLLPPRGRFQSEVDGASSRRRRPRPNSYDEFGAKPRRSRFESMVNLGVASGEHAIASDLMARDATEGSVSRQTLVVREEGKAPTHFVGISNCFIWRPVFDWRMAYF